MKTNKQLYFSRCTGGDYCKTVLSTSPRSSSDKVSQPQPAVTIIRISFVHFCLFSRSFNLNPPPLSSCQRVNTTPHCPKKDMKNPLKRYSVDSSSITMTTNKSDLRSLRLLPICRRRSSRLPLLVCIPFPYAQASARRCVCVFCTSFAEAAGPCARGRLLSPGR